MLDYIVMLRVCCETVNPSPPHHIGIANCLGGNSSAPMQVNLLKHVQALRL